MAMTRDEWNAIYAARLQEMAGSDAVFAMECAESADDSFNDEEDPTEAADNEIDSWGMTETTRMKMIPTSELRYTIRTIKNPNQQDPFLVAVDQTGKLLYKRQETVDIQVLQQKWVEPVSQEWNSLEEPRFEWRDVPFVKEE
jgi:hypothetical protein